MEDEKPAWGGRGLQEKCARAYALFFARGGEHGDDSDDWLRAETELPCEKE